MKKTAIMQPYFLPYIGYFQLINAVDEFVIYDNIQYTKKGWINRNRYLKNGKDDIFSLSLKKNSDYLNVVERFLSTDYKREKLLAQFQNAYAKAPYKAEILPLLSEIILFENNNLFNYIYNSVIKICEYLDINTKITISSKLDCDHNLKATQKVLEVCNAIDTGLYINAIGGIELYNKVDFNEQGIELMFLKSKSIVYKQFENDFVPWLSIVDVLMFNGKIGTQKMLGEYELI